MAVCWKSFLLFCALFVVIVPLHAAEISVPAGENTLSSAISTSSSGDILVLADGSFTEKEKVITVDHSLVLKAADGASPVVTLSERIDLR